MNNKESNVYQYGTTVRFECSFFNFDGQLIDPETVKVKVYDYKYVVIFEANGMKNSQGKYFYDYTTESKEKKLFYEWYGEIDGKPSLKRGEFSTKFI